MADDKLEVTGGVETLTVTGARPGSLLRIERLDGPPDNDADAGGDSAAPGDGPSERVGGHGVAVATLVADLAGNAHAAFVPPTHRVLRDSEDLAETIATGHTLAPGEYVVVDEASGDEYGPVRVLAVDDLPDPALYDQELAEGFGYLEVRDGVTLSVMVRFPNADLYGPGPWPTVIEYSGYGPSNPDAPQPGTLLANLLGFATVGVNMRGTGCSGGVFDVFSPAQAADGYDAVETVARQPWVLHGRPGMVGLSYPGISQLYVAATRPPHLAAITPLSVIDDLWRQQWPGGIYNAGFTRAWLAMRDEETQVGGQAWDAKRIEDGDEVAAANQRIRSQNFDFERFGRAIEHFRPTLDARRVGLLVDRIEVPVYLTGAWQDEQTGSRFALMLDDFRSAPHARFTVFNGHHPDGYSPMVIARWYEFLSFHVAHRVPRVPDLIRMFAPAQFADVFGFETELEPDRFAHHGDDLEAAMAEYLAEPKVRILFESGAGHAVPGATAHRFEASAESFPPAGVTPRRWWLDAGGALVEDPPADQGADAYRDDLESGGLAYSSELLSDLQRFTQPQVPTSWTSFDDEHRVAYETAPLDAAVTVAGAGHLDLWLRPGSVDTSVQVTITEIRPDGFEQRVQSGWHRLHHRVEDPARSDEMRVDYTYTPEDIEPLAPGEWVHPRVPIYPVTHLFRAGSRIRVAVSTPGRDHPFWYFDAPVTEGAEHALGRGGQRASSLVLPVWELDVDHPADLPAPGSLRGQPVRPSAPISNRAVSVA